MYLIYIQKQNYSVYIKYKITNLIIINIKEIKKQSYIFKIMYFKKNIVIVNIKPIKPYKKN